MALEKLAQIPSLVRKAGQAASKAQPFYSPVDQAIANITQGTGTGAQMLAELMKTKGVAKELKDRPAIKKALEQPKVTKQELEQVAAENPAPQIEEVADAASKFASYTIPGGENYREVLIRLPETNKKVMPTFEEWHEKTHIKPLSEVMSNPRLMEIAMRQYERDKAAFARNPDTYRSSHFDEPNILAHARVSDRVGPNGEKILHVEEVQSDWHQEGRKKGYNKLPEGAEVVLRGNYFTVRHPNGNLLGFGGYTQEDAIQSAIKHHGAVPNAPFKQNWHELVMKRLLDDAARNGYDKVVITPGAEQAKRYSLSNAVDEINVVGRTHALTGEQTKQVALDTKDGRSLRFGVAADGTIDNVSDSAIEGFLGKKLNEVVGKDVAKNIMEGGTQTISGEGLEVGGEGMKGFYDQILPSYLNEYGKKYGVRVGTYDMPNPKGSLSITDLQRERGMTEQQWLDLTPDDRMRMIDEYEVEAKANRTPLHSFDITPQMREDITTKGMPLYQVAPPVAIGAGAAMQEEEPAEYGKGGTVKRVINAVLPKGQQAVLPAAESVANLEKFLAGSAVKDRLYHATSRGGFSTFDRNKTTEWRQPSMDTVGSWFSNNPSEAGGAGMYASGESASIYPVHLSIKNPKVYSTFNDFLKDMHSAAGREMPKSAPGLGSTEELRQKLKAEGYDGIAFEQTANESLMQDIQSMQDAVKRARMEELSSKRAEREPYTMKRERLEQTLDSMRKELGEFGSSTEFDQQRVFVPFEPTQIKSSIGNRGTYDITDPDINMAGGGIIKKAAKALFKAPQEEALRLAQQRAALPVSQGGLGLPKNNTAEQRAKAMGFVDDSYHGSLYDIQKFNLNKASTESAAGQGVYSTSSPKDASINYANVYGPDVETKINRYFDESDKNWRRTIGRLQNQTLTPRQEEILLRQTLNAQNAGVVYPLKIRSDKSIHLDAPEKNPVQVGPFERYDEALDQYVDTPHTETFNRALDEFSAMGGDTNRIREAVWDLGDGEPVNARDLFNEIKKGNRDILYDPDSGELVSGGVAAGNFLRHFGVDEIRHTPEFGNQQLNIGKEHRISLNPDNIRSRFAAFDPWRINAATAAAMGVAAPDLLAKEKKAKGGQVSKDTMWMAVQNKQIKKRAEGGAVHMAKGGDLIRAGKSLMRMKNRMTAEPFAKPSIVKEPGGNWLMGSVEQSIDPLKITRQIMTPEKVAAQKQSIETARRILGDRAPQATIEQMEREIQQSHQGTAINQWIDRNLTNYIKKQMATPEDPVRKLAEQGIVHMPPEQMGYGSSQASMVRNKLGTPRLGQSPEAQAWEDATDVAINPLTIKDVQESRKIGMPWAEWAFEPWMKEADPQTKIFRPTDNMGARYLGFDHIVDELKNATNPLSGLPRELQIKPESLSKLSMSQAVERVAKINAWREAQKAEANAALAMNPATVVHREYPTIPGTDLPNERGLRWVEMRAPEELPAGWREETREGRQWFFDPEGKAHNVDSDPRYASLQDALKYEGETMGHCVGGYCPDVVAGKTRIYSLRDAKGQPHVTIEVRPGESLQGLAAYQARYPEGNIPSEIVQIKGKANRKPNEEYLPFVQDFVRSGQWSDVGDIQNTGMRAKSSVFSDQELARLQEAGAADIPHILTGEEIQRLHNMIVPEGKRLKYDAAGNIIGDEAGYAKGGAVSCDCDHDAMQFAVWNKQLRKKHGN